MKRIDPGIMIVGEELVLAKYDTDKDGKLSDEEIARELQSAAAPAAALVQRAREAGGRDNVTVLLLSFVPEEKK